VKKKILLLTASYGTGHVTASKCVQKALNELYPDTIETETIDILKTDKFNSSKTFIQRMYNKSMEKPIIWDWIFKLSDNRLAHWYFNIVFAVLYKHRYEMFNVKNPDAVVITHPYWSFIVHRYNTKYNKKLKTFCVVTDSTTIHYAWYHECIDYYLVPDDSTKDVMVNRFKIDPAIIYPMGFPVSIELGKPFTQKPGFLTELGLKPDLPTLLFVIGLGDITTFTELIQFLNSLDKKLIDSFQMIIVCGKYKELHDELSVRKFNVLTKVIGWTDKMHDFIRASDMAVSKGGGAIITETLAAATPAFIPVFTPGQERGNARFITNHGIGFAETDIEKSKSILVDVITNTGKLKQMRDNIKKINKPNAPVDISKFVIEHLV
jgi:processive 1,2-diacylglycerol beta-glucosyltransferase